MLLLPITVGDLKWSTLLATADSSFEIITANNCEKFEMLTLLSAADSTITNYYCQ